MRSSPIVICLAGALSLGTGLALSQTLAGGRLRAGAAKVDITPRQDQLAIATDSIRDHLYVRAIVVDDGRNCAALVNIDGGARDAVVNPAIEKSSASAKCAPENYICLLYTSPSPRD